ncbi:MAG: hypothetical protein DMD83_01885 [Candidatus Rokuibacteriota bacterium]|nr:MAG: hypothetical protein DMD83_01885 [Candidatus Rokubacteria bacterium]
MTIRAAGILAAHQLLRAGIAGIATFSVAWLAALAPPAGAQLASVVPNPVVTGPIPGVMPGDPSHDYPFFATDVDLASRGYLEEEFFFEGVAAGAAYRTRMVVRRPVSPLSFNGTVIVEWYNVTNNYDSEADWFRAHEHLLRSGYAWVGVSAQSVGVNDPSYGLKVWSPARYGTLSISDDRQSFDIYSQAIQALRRPVGVDPMSGLRIERVIATGASQSAIFLGAYYNSVQAAHRMVDAFALIVWSIGVNTEAVRTPVLMILSETDVYEASGLAGHFPAPRQPNTDLFRRWEVAGASHSDFQMHRFRRPLQIRDLGIDLGPNGEALGCTLPLFSRIPFHYVMSAGYDALARWVMDGTPPPIGPDIAFSGTEIARDEHGNSLGGIRLSQHEVATATNTGQNAGPGLCPIRGSYVPFDDATLQALYPTHGDYIDRVTAVTDQTVQAGFVLPPDADETIADAKRAKVPPRP